MEDSGAFPSGPSGVGLDADGDEDVCGVDVVLTVRPAGLRVFGEPVAAEEWKGNDMFLSPSACHVII